MRRLLTGFILTVMVAGVVSAAGPRPSRGDRPLRYLPNALDGPIVQAGNSIDGRIWSVWSYRNGGEYDLALSFSVAPGIWSEPSLIGLDDGLDQRQPAIAVDFRGAIYVAYADGTGAIRLTALQPGATRWSFPATVAQSAGDLSRPSLMVLGDALIVGYRDGAGVALQAVPLIQPAFGNQVRSIYDGPDPTTGFDDGDDAKDETAEDEDAVFSFGANGSVSLRPVNSGTNDDDR